jgi:hypothetical protein
MKRKHILISVLSVLVLVTLSCGFLSRPEPTAEPTKPAAATKAPEPTKAPQPTKEPEPTKEPKPTKAPVPDVELGEEVRSEDGGYSFRTIPGYTTEEAFGMTSMEAPDADPNTGPAIMLMGGLGEESMTAEEFFADFTSELEEGVDISPARKIDVDGRPGVIADVSGAPEGEEIVGRIVAVAPTPNHHFIMVAAAPADQWEDFGPLFEAVLASVRFFAPSGGGGGSEVVPTMAGELRQWAVYAEASSEYGDVSWSAMQATGAPDTADCGDYTTAWAAENYDTAEWIELEYDTPVLPTEVNIYQTYNPNQVVEVELRDVLGDYHTIYTGMPRDESDNCPFILHVAVEGADYQVVAVRITLDQSVLENWNEIDAVELVGIAERPGG